MLFCFVFLYMHAQVHWPMHTHMNFLYTWALLAAMSCVQYRKEIISFLRSWWGPAAGGATDIEEDRMRSAVLWIGWLEALCISYRTTSRHLEIESLGGCSGLDGLKDKNRDEWWEMSTRRLLHRNQSQSCLESDCKLRGWGVKVILFQAGCGGQEALWPRIHHGQNTPLKPAWPSTCRYG